jgi:hypothetical protein
MYATSDSRFMARISCPIGALAVVFAVLPATASSSELIGWNAVDVRLATSTRSGAVVTYRSEGRTWQVGASAAVNARTPSKRRPQVSFALERRAVYGTPSAGSACGRYDGPPLHWLVAACKAPDGSYWAVQSWRRALPSYGATPIGRQGAWELRLSHWRGPLPSFYVNVDWTYGGRFDHLYGSLEYHGSGVFGFRWSSMGTPLDAYGRNVYVDTYNSAYGSGWRRENAFLTRSPTGTFCYGFFGHGARPPGEGDAYRATVVGPGVTPDLFWRGEAPGAYDALVDRARNREQQRLRTLPGCYSH